MPIATQDDFAIWTATTNPRFPPYDPDEAEWNEPASRADGAGNPVVDGFARVVWRWPRTEECLVTFMAGFYDLTNPDIFIRTRHRDGGYSVSASAKFFSWTARKISPTFWEATATFIRVVEE